MSLYKFRKAIYRWLTADDDNKIACSATREKIARREGLDDDHSINFKIIKGIGGVAIQYGQYNHQRDQHEVTLHIVPEDKDLAVELAHIITMQSLRS